MELAYFQSILRKRWYITVLFLGLAILGTYVYHRYADMETAQATVAVLDPLNAKSTYAEAQITFDAVIKSDQLARRVAARTGLPAGLISKNVSASVLPTLSAFNASPLYGVRAKAKTKAAAIALANVVLTEARLLYIELNTADTTQIRSAMQPEYTQVEAELTKARNDYDSFVAANQTGDLPSRVDRQMNIVASLQQQFDQILAAEHASGQSRGRASNALRIQVVAEQAVLDRLNGLRSQFNALAFRLQLAQSRLSQLSSAEEGLVAGQRLPFQVDVKILDFASVQSPFFWLFITYSSAILFAIFLALSTVYLMGLTARPMQTADEISRTFGSPILVRIPRAGP
ncbi:MAG: hypothetical protein M3082_20280 [Candidatus Dormibacteraeota bacterium]|nr:hypothetical protein [Candidatus Dormibacteraeota bacterium]